MNFGASVKTSFAALALLIAASTTVHAAAGPRFMPQGQAVAPPPGFAALCEREPGACVDAASAARPLTLALAAPAMTTSSLGGAAFAPPLRERADRGSTLIGFDSLTAVTPVVEAVLATAPMLSAEDDDWTALAVSSPTPAAPTVRLTKDQMALVNRINRDVNRDVKKANDFDLYGLLEYWTTPLVVDGKMYGDCEDYALEKRRRLIAAGVSAADLSLAVAVTARGEAHAVLVVAFEDGDIVLDNLTPWATPWTALNYRWIQRQVAGATAWAAIL